MMTSQTILPFQYEVEKRSSNLTSLAGLPLYLELAHAITLFRSINHWLKIRRSEQGFTDAQILSALILLQIAGGDSIDDLNRLKSDDGFISVANRLALSGLKRKQRREIERRWNRDQEVPAIPSVSVVRRWLAKFHNSQAEKQRAESGAFIPSANQHLSVMAQINLGIVNFMQRFNPCKIATLDMDATLIETQKKGALYCYKKFQAYQPLNTWWAEQQMMIHTEFRDGNVPAGYEQKRVLEESLSLLPKTVKEVRLRSDSAGYQWDLMRFCQKGDKKFGSHKILFAIAGRVTDAFREEVLKVADDEWRPIYQLMYKGKKYEKVLKSKQQWVEVGFVPSKIVSEPEDHYYRFIATRESIQTELPGAEEPTMPFSTYKTKKGRYKLFSIVTNIHQTNDKELEVNRGRVGVFNGNGMWGESIIHWHRERCGRSEQAHTILKTDLGGGKLPSAKFGANAAWWWISVMTLNLHRIMSQLVLGKSWENSRMKAVRFRLINIPARILEHGRQIFIRVSKSCTKAYETWQIARARLMELLHSPG